MRSLIRPSASAGLLLLVAASPSAIRGTTPAPAVTLRVEQFTGDSTAFDVNAALVIGPTESILFDTQYLVRDATRIADRIAATGTHLKAIVLTHPDDDHYYGAATILARFPGTPVYISAKGLDQFTSRELPQFKSMKARPAGMAIPPGRALPALPDSLVTPQVFPTTRLTVDGEELQLFPDVQGDVLEAANSYCWIPSLRTVITGDVTFNGVHVWLAASSVASRAAWQQSLRQIATLEPAVVIAGHKARVDTPDTPDVITRTAAYLTDFDAAVRTSTTPDALVAIMDQKYPTLAVHRILVAAAQHAFAK